MPHQLDDELLQYSVQNSTKEDAILSALRKRTWQKVLTPQMLSDPIQGKFLQNLSRIVRPKRILELGTYTGYSTICLASGLSADGVIDTVEPNDELNSIQEEFWQKAGIIERVNRFNAEALEVLPNLSGLYDIIWIDADKPRTRLYADACLPLLRPGGWLLVDNVLWWGKVLPSHAETDATAEIMKSTASWLASRSDVRTTLLPIRDGILMVEKLGATE